MRQQLWFNQSYKDQGLVPAELKLTQVSVEHTRGHPDRQIHLHTSGAKRGQTTVTKDSTTATINYNNNLTNLTTATD